MWYAFARDDGMPGARWLKRVSGRHHTPAVAIVVTSALSVAICLYAAAWFVVTSISTICLYLAYGIPIYLNLRNRLRGRGAFMTGNLAPWTLGRWSPWLNAIAIAWDRAHHDRLHAPAERAGAVDHARRCARAHPLVVDRGAETVSRTGEGVTGRESFHIPHFPFGFPARGSPPPARQLKRQARVVLGACVCGLPAFETALATGSEK
jgi:hypothetical protein